jgi:hypothetical protein
MNELRWFVDWANTWILIVLKTEITGSAFYQLQKKISPTPHLITTLSLVKVWVDLCRWVKFYHKQKVVLTE